MKTHLRFCFQNLYGSSHLNECRKMFAKYLNNTIERVDALV